MNFKKEYEKAFSQIKAEEEFKASLVKDMYTAQSSVKKNYVYGNLAVAAVIIILVMVRGYATGSMYQKEDMQAVSEEQSLAQNDIDENVDIDFHPGVAAQQGNMDSFTELDISGLSWYGAIENEEELLLILVELIDGDTLKALYHSDSADFTKESLMAEDEIQNLLEKLKSMVYTELDFVGSPQYYQAVFQDGMKIKFQISDKGYLFLEDTETVYCLPE